MSDIAISARDLGKKYFIGHLQKALTFRESLSNAAVAPFRKAARLLKGHATGAAGLDEVFWALRDVSFDIRKGEVIGIIGRNGAGKSTLLKVLSRITVPTEGQAKIHGRVASLLEVGTGFHHELTGRENVFLNGSILGMSNVEIIRKFDEIVAFAEIEKFIDTPIKHYSSGMGVRLAFAIAAHLEPEILIVDEVLAVGDMRFQRKCLDRMESVGEEGRTVLFVSHNMPAVTRMCPRILLLDQGRLVEDGPAHEVAGSYLSFGTGTSAERIWADPAKAPGRDVARLRALRVCAADGSLSNTVDIRKPLTVEMEYDVIAAGKKLLPHLLFVNENGVILFTTMEVSPQWFETPRQKGRYRSRVKLPGNLLAEGLVIITAVMATLDANVRVLQFHERDAVAFHVVDSHEGGSSRERWTGQFPGVMRPKLDWDTDFRSAQESDVEFRQLRVGC